LLPTHALSRPFKLIKRTAPCQATTGSSCCCRQFVTRQAKL
jgi:hypothetical protein